MRNLLLVLILALTGCSSLITGYTDGTVSLDSSYMFYAREVYRKEEAGQEKTTETNSDNKSRNDLLEVQFMLLSPSRGTAIYIAMSPDYKRKKYADYDKATLNLEDINSVRFGRAMRTAGNRVEKIKFFSKDGYTSSIWQLNGISDSSMFWVDRIQYWFGEYDNSYLKYGIDFGDSPNEFLENEINVHEALAEPVIFKRVQVNKIRIDKDKTIPIPPDSQLRFTSHGSKVSMEYFGDGVQQKKIGNKRIRSTPIVAMDRKVK